MASIKNTGKNRDLSAKLNTFLVQNGLLHEVFCLDDHHFRDFSMFFFNFSRFFCGFCSPMCLSLQPGRPLTGGPGGLFGAAKNGNLPALRHFLRADPRSGVHKKRPSDGRWPQPRVGGVVVTWKTVPEDDPKIFNFGAFLKRNLDFSSVGVYFLWLELADYLRNLQKWSEENHRWSKGGTKGNEIDVNDVCRNFIGASCNTKHEQRSNKGLWKNDGTSPQLFWTLYIVHLWTLETLKCWTWFQTVHALNWLIYLMTSFFTRFVSFFKKGYCRALYWGNCCCETNYALKIVWCTCVCEHILLWTGLKRLSPKLSSFVRWLNRWSSAAHNYGRRPRGNRLRQNAAALGGKQRARGGCGAPAVQKGRSERQDQRWPGASKHPKQRSLRRVTTLRVFGGLKFWKKTRCIFSKCWAKCGFPPLNIRQMQMLGSMISM